MAHEKNTVRTYDLCGSRQMHLCHRTRVQPRDPAGRKTTPPFARCFDRACEYETVSSVPPQLLS